MLRFINTLSYVVSIIVLSSSLKLSIQHFNRATLRKVQTRDHSQPMVEQDKDYEGDVSSEDDKDHAIT